MASAMISRIMNTTHNSIKIKQTQKGGNNIIQSQSIHINGDGNRVVGIHVDMDGNVIEHTVDDFNHGKKTVEEMRNDIFKFNHADVYNDWTIDDDVAVENMNREHQENMNRKWHRDSMKKRYHKILNTDDHDKEVGSLNDYLHFEDTTAYKEGYVLNRQVQDTNINEVFRILPAFISKKLNRITGENAIPEVCDDPIIHTDVNKACNYYYRVSDGALFALINNRSRYGYDLRLEECQLIQLKYFRDNDVSAYIFYDPKKDYLYTKDDNTIILQHVTMTNMQKIIYYLSTNKIFIALIVLIIIIYIKFH